MTREKMISSIRDMYEVNEKALNKATDKELADICIQGHSESEKYDSVRIFNSEELKQLKAVK